MAEFEIKMPKLGESVEEATITKWFIKEGDTVEEDDALLEIATDKVDSEIPSPVAGAVKKILFKEDDLVAVGETIAIIDMEGEVDETSETETETETEDSKQDTDATSSQKEEKKPQKEETKPRKSQSERFYSPLVRKMAKEHNLSDEELESITGTGLNSRVKKEDILKYLETRGKKEAEEKTTTEQPKAQAPQQFKAPKIKPGEGDEVIEMDRMRQKIAEHMMMSINVSAHVTNFIEADVTNIVIWRNKMKQKFLEREKEKLTYMPLFTEAIAKALKEYPRINASVSENKIILRKHINIGIAVALSDGNLIVPVVKDADHLNIIGLSKEINRLAEAARTKNLKPDDTQGGTFSISNFGTFKNLTGTPIINQPQVAIIATGNIEKKPAVIETSTGDIIGIRHKMMLSLTYDHRIIDGALGGMFLKAIADNLESFSPDREI